MEHEFFTIGELLHSETAIAQKINNYKTTQEIEENLDALIVNVLDPIRREFGAPIRVDSGFRCEALNKAVKGATNSQHMRGQAADLMVCSGGKKELTRLYNIIKEKDVDQLLFEYDSKGSFWIHVSYRRDGKNRNDKRDNYKANR